MHRTVVALYSEQTIDTVDVNVPVDELRTQKCGIVIRMLWRFLVWLGLKLERTEEWGFVRTIEIDTEKVLDAVRLSEREMYQVYSREARYLVIGRDLASRLFGEMNARQYFTTPLSGCMGFDGQTTVFGLTLVVMPWIKGFCLLPELKEQTQPQRRENQCARC